MTKVNQQPRDFVNLNCSAIKPFAIRKRNRNNEEVLDVVTQNWRKFCENSKSDMASHLQPNILLRIDGNDIPIHSVLLASHSDNCNVWSPTLTSNSSKTLFFLDLTGKSSNLTFEALMATIQLLYEGQISILRSSLPSLLSVATFFELTAIKQKCGEILLRLAEESPKNLLLSLQLSFTHKLSENVKEKLVSQTANAVTSLILLENGTRLFNLSGDVVESVLSSNEIDAPAPIEFTVFLFVIEWLKRNYKEAPKYASSLLGTCRFGQMTTAEKFKCMDEAKRCGLGLLVRTKIVIADWQKTCEEWGKTDKCIEKSVKRNKSPQVPTERRAVPNRATLPPPEIVRGEHASPKVSYPSSMLSQKIVNEENAKEVKPKVKKLNEENAKKENAEEQKPVEEKPIEDEAVPKMVPEQTEEERRREEKHLKKELRRQRRAKRRERKLIEEEMEEEDENEIAVREKEPKDKEKMKKDFIKIYSNWSLSPPKPVNADSIERLVHEFTKLLNKKGTRLLKKKLMDPEYGKILRKAIKGKGEGLPSQHIVMQRDVHEDTVQQTNEVPFLYSPESAEYKMYVESKKISSKKDAKALKVAERASRIRLGGRPLLLRQTVVHTKKEDGNECITGYERKMLLKEPKKSANSEFNKITYTYVL